MWIDPELVSLRPITAETVRAVCALAVADDQRHRVAPNAVSLAEALFSPCAWYRAICLEDAVVGFVMLYDSSLGAASASDPQAVVWRFMVDARSQGKGIGRAALLLVIEHVRGKRLFPVLSLSYVPGPDSAEKFYLDLGFKPTGKVEDGEVELELSLDPHAAHQAEVPKAVARLPVLPSDCTARTARTDCPVAAVLVHVPDVEAGLAWYQRAFPQATVEVLENSFSRLVLDGVGIELVPADAKVSSGAAGSVVYWRVAQFESALAHAQGLGATLYRGPLAIEDGQCMAQVRDPWGNCIGFRGPSKAGSAP